MYELQTSLFILNVIYYSWSSLQKCALDAFDLTFRKEKLLPVNNNNIISGYYNIILIIKNAFIMIFGYNTVSGNLQPLFMETETSILQPMSGAVTNKH